MVEDEEEKERLVASWEAMSAVRARAVDIGQGIIGGVLGLLAVI